MNNIIAVFANRSFAMQFASALKRMGINSKVIDTPRDLSSACGISILFAGRNLDKVKALISRLRSTGTVRLYMITGDLFKTYLPI